MQKAELHRLYTFFLTSSSQTDSHNELSTIIEKAKRRNFLCTCLKPLPQRFPLSDKGLQFSVEMHIQINFTEVNVFIKYDHFLSVKLLGGNKILF